jgi:hypothetical protein
MRAAIALALLSLATGCGAPNSLGGSLSELFPLEVSRSEVLINDEAFQVSYYNNRGTEVDLVVRVTVVLQGIELKQGKRITLQGEYAPGHQRTTVAHLAGGEPLRLLPPVKKGDLVVDRLGQPGQTTSGHFSMSFGDGGDLGAGRSLSGNFSSVAIDAGFERPDAGLPYLDGGVDGG